MNYDILESILHLMNTKCSLGFMLNFLRFPTKTALKATAISNVKLFYFFENGQNAKSYREINGENIMWTKHYM